MRASKGGLTHSDFMDMPWAEILDYNQAFNKVIDAENREQKRQMR